MYASVKEVRKELGENKTKQLNVCDQFRNIVNAIMAQITKDNEYAQIPCKWGRKGMGILW